MIIPFQPRPHIVVTCRQVYETRRETSFGIDVIRHKPPIETFFIDYVEDGFSCCVWDGQTRARALAVAQSWANEGVTVRDRTIESAGRL